MEIVKPRKWCSSELFFLARTVLLIRDILSCHAKPPFGRRPFPSPVCQKMSQKILPEHFRLNTPLRNGNAFQPTNENSGWGQRFCFFCSSSYAVYFDSFQRKIPSAHKNENFSSLSPLVYIFLWNPRFLFSLVFLFWFKSRCCGLSAVTSTINAAIVWWLRAHLAAFSGLYLSAATTVSLT